MDKKKEERIAKQEIRGVMPAKDLSTLLQQSINLASAIEILNARTKTLERLIAENGVKEKKKPRFTFPPLKQIRGDKKTDDDEIVLEFPDFGNNTLLIDDLLSVLFKLTTITNIDGSTTTTIGITDGTVGVPHITQSGYVEMIDKPVNNTLVIDDSLSSLFKLTTVTNNDGSTTTTISLADGVVGVPSITLDGSIEMLETATCPVARDYGAE